MCMVFLFSFQDTGYNIYPTGIKVLDLTGENKSCTALKPLPSGAKMYFKAAFVNGNLFV